MALDWDVEADRDRKKEYKGFYLTACDPYAFVTVRPFEGPTPDYFNGVYTDFMNAQKAVDIHLGQVAAAREKVDKVAASEKKHFADTREEVLKKVKKAQDAEKRSNIDRK